MERVLKSRLIVMSRYLQHDSDEQIFTALLGIEAYLAAKNGLHINDIREIMDDMKEDLTVKPKAPDSDGD